MKRKYDDICSNMEPQYEMTKSSNTGEKETNTNICTQSTQFVKPVIEANLNAIFIHDTEDMLVLQIEWKGKQFIGALLNADFTSKKHPFNRPAITHNTVGKQEENNSGISIDDTRKSDILDLL